MLRKVFFEFSAPKMTLEHLGMLAPLVKDRFSIGGNNFYFFTHHYLGFISKVARFPLPKVFQKKIVFPTSV